MKKICIWDSLVNKNELSKTLRFELKPIGKTLDYIKERGLIEKDEKKEKEAKQAKGLMDTYWHKPFIKSALNKLKLKNVSEYAELYAKIDKDDGQKERLNELNLDLRKQISKCFSEEEKELGITVCSFKSFIENDEVKKQLKNEGKDSELEIIESFNGFTTYFTGFDENRKNIYVEDDIHTSIANRLINDNLPKYILNIKLYEKIKSNREVYKQITDSEKSLKQVLDGFKIDEVFDAKNYSDFITSESIQNYNYVIGGFVDKDVKIQGINEIINFYNQKVDKKDRLPKLKPLYKMILDESVNKFDCSSEIESAKEAVDIINNDINHIYNLIITNGNNTIKDCFNNLIDYEIESIYLTFKNNVISNISNRLCGKHDAIINLLRENYDNSYSGKTKPNTLKYFKEKDTYFKNKNIISLDNINNLNIICDKDYKNIFDYLTKELNLLIDNLIVAKEKYDTKLNNVSSIFTNEQIELIKDYLDTIKDIERYIKQFIIDDIIDKDEDFYDILETLLDNLNIFDHLYNSIRNFITKKPFVDKKFRINFENSTLLNGWDVNKERDNTCVILRKNGLYYLAIMNPKNLEAKKAFDDEHIVFSRDDNCFEKMYYKYLPDPSKMLPKVFLSKKGCETYQPSIELLNSYAKGTHKKGKNFNLNDLHRLINYYKKCICKHEYNNFCFEFSDTKTYKDLSMFYREIENRNYKIEFKKVDNKYIEQLVSDGKIYLFQIYNKDFSLYSKGTPNMHTLYFRELFSDANLTNSLFRLSGGAELFYRRKSLDGKITHPKNNNIDNKNINNPKKHSRFNYDLIKDKRYSEDKFFFHVPIKLNANCSTLHINDEVKNIIKNNDVNIIGIDRGERHLLYVTVIDKNGNIIKDNNGKSLQFSLNEIVNFCNTKSNEIYEIKTDYNALLQNKSDLRDKEKKSWKSIENIKELKEGYLSQVIHKITELMIKYNAIVVLEDLNSGFKNSRAKVEKNIYQLFEKKLIDKLNFLVFKGNDSDIPGGLRKAYQLASGAPTYKDIKFQTGALFYVAPWNTSKIDPTTGFVNMFYVKYESVDKSKDFIRKIDDIRYNETEKYYEFDIDYKNGFSSRNLNSKTAWTICTFGNRIINYIDEKKNNKWSSYEINLTNEFSDLFNKYKVDMSNIKESVLSIEEKEFYVKFLHLFKAMVNLRNSEIGTKNDYIQSPVKNKYGEFYCSKTCDDNLPKDADANGAYNIARKGLILVERIKKSSDDLKISNSIKEEDWLNFIQK